MDTKKRSVLFLASWYPKRVKPSNGSFIFRYAHALSEHADIYVLHAAEDPDLSKRREISIERSAGLVTVIVYYRKSFLKIPFIGKPVKYLFAQLAGYRKIKSISGGIDIAHVHVTFPAGLFALFLKYKYKIPYIITEHWTGYSHLSENPAQKLHTMIARKVVAGSTAITVPTRDLKRVMENRSIKGKYIVVRNMIDFSVFNYSLKRQENERFRFLHISSLYDPQKNISGMLRAVKILSDKRNDFEIIIAGKGNVQKYILLAEELMIHNSYVTFKGEQDQQEVARRMAEADCFFMFSNYENFPFVIIEAMASGIPVITTNVGGIAECMNKKTGLLVDPGNENVLADAMERMILSNKNYSGQAIREFAKNNFNGEEIVKEFLKLYQEA